MKEFELPELPSGEYVHTEHNLNSGYEWKNFSAYQMRAYALAAVEKYKDEQVKTVAARKGSEQQERVKFEIFVGSLGSHDFSTRRFDKSQDAIYSHHVTRLLWRTWQARASLDAVSQQSATVSSDIDPVDANFEEWYACNSHDYIANPIGSRDCGLQRKAWNAALQYAATQRSERDKAVDEVLHDNGMSEQSQTQRYKAHMFDEIRKIWRGEK